MNNKEKQVEKFAKTIYKIQNPDNVKWESFGGHSEVRKMYLILATKLINQGFGNKDRFEWGWRKEYDGYKTGGHIKPINYKE